MRERLEEPPRNFYNKGLFGVKVRPVKYLRIHTDITWKVRFFKSSKLYISRNICVTLEFFTSLNFTAKDV